MAKPMKRIHGTYSIFTYHLVDFDGLTIGKYTLRPMGSVLKTPHACSNPWEVAQIPMNFVVKIENSELGATPRMFFTAFVCP